MAPRYHGSEREILDDTVDRNREALIASVARLSDAESRRRLVASATTPIDLISHAAAAERFWFQRFLDRRSECDGPADPGESSYAAPDSATLDEELAEFRAAMGSQQGSTA